MAKRITVTRILAPTNRQATTFNAFFSVQAMLIVVTFKITFPFETFLVLRLRTLLECS